MNQDFTVKKSNICLKKKIRAGGFTWKKNSCTSSARKKKFVQAENPPPPPITFLMVRPLKWEGVSGGGGGGGFGKRGCVGLLLWLLPKK